MIARRAGQPQTYESMHPFAGVSGAGPLGGQIPSVRDFVETLEKRGGLYLSDSVKAEALKLAGELP